MNLFPRIIPFPFFSESPQKVCLELKLSQVKKLRVLSALVFFLVNFNPFSFNNRSNWGIFILYPVIGGNLTFLGGLPRMRIVPVVKR